MSCPRKVVADILNNCIRPVRGIKPLAYWAYRSDVTFTYSANEITAIDTIALGSFESVKFGLNAGHDLVPSDIADDGYKHKFSGVFNVAANADLDTMEDIVVFVQTANDLYWLCYGAKNGLWKETQVKMANDNLSTIAVEFGSREGMEEEYSEYVVADDDLIVSIPKTTEYEVITGLSLADGSVTPQQVTLLSEPTPFSYVILPDGSQLTTNVSGEIYTTWAGIAGNITLIIPKGNPIALSDGGNSPADFIGQLIANTPEHIQIDGCINITSVTAPLATVFISTGCTSLESISAPNSTLIDAAGCALTANAIAAQVRATVLNIADLSTIVFDFSGGTNASYATLSAQAQSDIQAIITAGGTVTYNA